MSASSPRMSRYARDAELEMERTKPRVGLSQYTTSRLAELRARRAAQEDDLKSITSLASGVTSSPGVTGELSGRSSSDGASVTSHSVTGNLSGRASSSIGTQDKSSRRSRQEVVSSTENTSKPENNKSPVIRSSPKKLPSDSLAPSAKSPTNTEVVENSLTRDQLRADQEVSQHRKQLENGSTQETDLHQGRQKISLSSKARDLRESVPQGDTEGVKSLSLRESVPQGHTERVKSLSLRESVPQGDTERVKSLSLRESVPQGDTERVKSLSLRESVPQGDTERGALMSDSADIVSRCKEYKATYSHTMDALAHLGRSNSKSLTDLEDDDSVGFSSLPEQVHRKALKRGFDFTLMVVGESGLGKSTLIQSLFLNTELYNDRKIGAVHERILKTVEIEKKYMEIEERGVKLRLTIVDTPGFNDSLCGEDSWKPVETYIDDQFEQYFKDESGLNRKNIKDNRVHCCLYFVSPFGHGLRPLDIYFMKRLHHKVNIVPIIAKADTLTHAEVRKMKASIMDQIENSDIQIYEFPDCDSDEDEEFKKQDLELKASIPFAVIGSNTIVEVGGKKIRGRLYPWGIVEVDNPDHCDFTKLRQMLISTHMQDLKDVTRDSHYENYRAKHISEQINKQAQRDRNKLKRDSSPNFETIVATEQLLEQKDQEIREMQEMLVKMQTHLKASQSPVSKPKMSGLGNL